MKKVIQLYLYIIPFYSLIGIILGIFRTAYQDNYAQVFLLIGAILDLVIILAGKKYILNKVIGFTFLLLLCGFVAGLLNNNELSRRYVTDFTNPFFFFSKIYVFAAFWKQIDFQKFVSYYKKIAFFGSMALLPLTYSLFKSAGVTRLAIFPPMELPFAFFMQTGGVFFMISLFVILLYGKRAQFISAIVTFFLFVFVFKRKDIAKYLIILVLGTFVLITIFSVFSQNLAVQRLANTFDKFKEFDGGQGAVEDIGGSRTAEVESIMKEMTTISDYIFGKGFGYTYKTEFNEIDKVNANAHFSPVAFLSKYGIVFTFFIYYFILSKIFVKKRALFDTAYITAVGTCFFVFFESFFSYAIFVTPVFPIVFGYVIYRQKQLLR